MIDLITGHQGIPHISAEQISTLHRSLMGTSGDNTVIKMTGGNLTQAGLAVEISAGFWRVHGYDMEIQEGEKVLFDPTESGYSRIDNVYVEVLQDISSGVQRAELVNVMGEPSTTTPTAPSTPTEPENSYDILVVAVPVLAATITEGAMAFTDLTTQYEVVTQEDIEDVQTLAEEAQSSASNAQSIASSAQTTANAASTNANNALNMIRRPTDDYSEFKSYSVGDYCIYNNRVYKCITACSAGSWTTNQNCFEWVSLTSAVTDLNSALSHVGMIIHSTTLSTLTQVQAIYGSNTTWIQHSGYMLRGATSGVTANSATKTGGTDSATMPSHNHSVNLGYRNDYIPSGGSGTVNVFCRTALQATEQQYSTYEGTNSDTGNIPNYKSVYIWERTA